MGTVMSRVRAVIGMRVISLALVASVVVGGCVTNPATGKKEFSLMSVQQEMQLGAEADAQIVAEFGLYNDAAIASYVSSMGNKVLAGAPSTGFSFNFRVLDSPVINAFALPGGYIYVTRGLLANLENDAQLAVILGHEIGHVTARHSARAYTSAQLANIGVGLGSVLFEEVRPFLGAVQTGLQLLFLKFSRANETEADDLGVQYATKTGYDAKQAAEFFHSLERIQSEAEMKNGGKLPTWQSTHPDPGDREATVTQLSATYAAQIAPTGGLGGVNPKEYNARLENLVYGPDPRQGFVENGYFNHPALKFRFQVPSGWAVANFATLVQMAPQSGEAAAEMSTVSGGTPSQIASSFLSQTGATVVQPAQNVTVNGLSAVRLVSSLNMDNGQGGVIPLTIMSYFIAKENLVYVFHGYSTSAVFANYQGAFETSFRSFATLTDQGALAVQPYRLDVFDAPRSAAFNALVSPPAQKRGVPETVSITELAIMNQVETSETVAAGTPLKKID
jgi:predicted Zn-dependent protease